VFEHGYLNILFKPLENSSGVDEWVLVEEDEWRKKKWGASYNNTLCCWQSFVELPRSAVLLQARGGSHPSCTAITRLPET
jgi:hypothetical protein